MPSRHDYRIGWICALPVELAAAQAMLDTTHPSLPNIPGDNNSYVLGSIGGHNIVIACLPAGTYGTTSATATATQMRFNYQSIQCCLLVGIGGGVPGLEPDIRLGDVVVSEPMMRHGGVIQYDYDYDKAIERGQFMVTGILDKPPEVLLRPLARLKAEHLVHGSRTNDIYAQALDSYPRLRERVFDPGELDDRLFVADYSHSGSAPHCDQCDQTMLHDRPSRANREPRVFYGLIASANKVVRDAKMRDQLAQDHGIICFEMEAAGLMNIFPSLVIRGICDYSDSHKNKQWQGYAAMMAAAYAKELIIFLPLDELNAPDEVIQTTRNRADRQDVWGSIATVPPDSCLVLPNDIPDSIQKTSPEPSTSDTSTTKACPNWEGHHEPVRLYESSKCSKFQAEPDLTRDPISAYLNDSDNSNSSDLTLQPRYIKQNPMRTETPNNSSRCDSYAEKDHHYVIFYHVTCSTEGLHESHQERAFYLDHPRLFKGDSKMSALRGQREVEDVDEYLRRHNKIVFAVNKWFKCTDHLDTIQEFFHPLPAPDDPEIPESVQPYFFVLPKHSPLAEMSSETIELVSESLQHAVAETGMDYDELEHRGRFPDMKMMKQLMYYVSRSRDHLSKLSDDQRPLFNILLGYIELANADEYEEVDRLTADGLIPKEYLFSLYGPEQLLVADLDIHPRAYIVERSLSNTRSISLKLWSWQFDGVFSKKRIDWHLECPFSVTRDRLIRITSLEIYPLKYASSQTINLLRTRGHTFWNCRRGQFVSYDCPSAVHARDSRYMVDAKTYQEMHGTPSFPELHDLGPDLNDEPPHIFVLLLPHEIHAFGIHDKKWRALLVQHIKEIKWNQSAFDRLVMQHEKKELIEALVTARTRSTRSSDIIEGKGNALVVLLHGDAGTGKTLTAEAVAELIRKPLYRLTCKDIGSNAEEVERHLESALLMCSSWGCVVLLDEADVFLEERRETDIQRNALVSVFLRVLEYYDGILILTSNRVATLESTFKSRIQLAVHYPTLDFQGRYEIWLNFINGLKKTNPDVNIDDLKRHIQDLAAVKLNGRQIRNTVSTSLQLAQSCQRPLNYEHFKQVIGVAEEFEKHSESTRGYSGLDWAGDREIRPG